MPLAQEYKRTFAHAPLLEPHPVMEALAQLEVGLVFFYYE